MGFFEIVAIASLLLAAGGTVAGIEAQRKQRSFQEEQVQKAEAAKSKLLAEQEAEKKTSEVMVKAVQEETRLAEQEKAKREMLLLSSAIATEEKELKAQTEVKSQLTYIIPLVILGGFFLFKK